MSKPESYAAKSVDFELLCAFKIVGTIFVQYKIKDQATLLVKKFGHLQGMVFALPYNNFSHGFRFFGSLSKVCLLRDQKNIGREIRKTADHPLQAKNMDMIADTRIIVIDSHLLNEKK